jgi:hypothetical protein
MCHLNIPETITWVFLLLALSLLTCATAAAGEDKEKSSYKTFTLYWENDAFGGTDRDYSNGLKMTWSTSYGIANQEAILPEWGSKFANNLPFVNEPGASRAISISLGQDMYTPEDYSRTELIIDDRPYAGYLYISTGFHDKTGNRKTTWEFQLGVVGPLSLAEENQNLSHKILGAKKFEGWKNQLHNEPAIKAIYETQWLSFSSDHRQGLNYDLIPHLGFSAGNVSIYLNAGAELRFGLNLPANFGSCPIRGGCATNSAFITDDSRSPKGFRGWHLFAAFDGRTVFHDIFLDGNTFQESHSVDRELWIADLSFGVVFEYSQTLLTYSYIYRTKQFASQNNEQIFGSISVSWTYH